MSVFTYQWQGVPLRLNELLPKNVKCIVVTAPNVTVEVDLSDDTAKKDLDEAMAQSGWVPVP